MLGDEDKRFIILLEATGEIERVAKLTVFEGFNPINHDPIKIEVRDYGQSPNIVGTRFHIVMTQKGNRHISTEATGSSLKGALKAIDWQAL